MWNLKLSVLVLLAVLSGCSFTHDDFTAPEPIGRVIAANGFPVVIRNNQRYILAAQSEIYLSDIINSNDESRVEILLTDGELIAVGPESHLVLHESNRLTLTRGSVFISVVENSRLRLGTSLAALTLKTGSMLAMLNARTLETCLISGDLTVSNDNGETELLNPVTGASVIAGSAPQTPVNWGERRLERGISNIRVMHSSR